MCNYLRGVNQFLNSDAHCTSFEVCIIFATITSEGMNSKATLERISNHFNLFDSSGSPPAEGITMLERAGINKATFLLQPLDNILVSIL